MTTSGRLGNNSLNTFYWLSESNIEIENYNKNKILDKKNCDSIAWANDLFMAVLPQSCHLPDP